MTSKELKKTDDKLIGKKELNKVFARSFFYGASWNYERMQNLDFGRSVRSDQQDDRT